MKKSKKAVYLAQPNCGDTHEILNVSMIIMLDKIYDIVKVYAPKDCCKVLKAGLKSLKYDYSSVQFIETKIYTKKQLPFWFFCGLLELFCMLKNRKADLFFSTLNFLWFPVFNSLSPLFSGNLYTLCHNDLEHLINPFFGKINIGWHLINYIFKRMRFSKNNYCLVLGGSIRENLFKYAKYETVEKNIIAINHPYYSIRQDDNVPNCLQSSKLKIAIVGTIKNKDKKNIEELNKALDSLESVAVYSISTYDFDLSTYKNITVINKENKHMPRKLYDELISEMDALYFPYMSNTYRVSASGAVHEAICKYKPIISMENDYFRALFAQFGDIGFLFKDFSELRNIFIELKKHNQVNLFKTNCIKASFYLSPKNYSKLFKKTIGQC